MTEPKWLDCLDERKGDGTTAQQYGTAQPSQTGLGTGGAGTEAKINTRRKATLPACRKTKTKTCFLGGERRKGGEETHGGRRGWKDVVGCMAGGDRVDPLFLSFLLIFPRVIVISITGVNDTETDETLRLPSGSTPGIPILLINRSCLPSESFPRLSIVPILDHYLAFHTGTQSSLPSGRRLYLSP